MAGKETGAGDTGGHSKPKQGPSGGVLKSLGKLREERRGRETEKKGEPGMWGQWEDLLSGSFLSL